MNIRACFFARIHGIPVWEISESPNRVEFMDASLDLSILQFHQNAKGLEFLNFQRSFETFQVGGILKCLARNKAFANAYRQDATSYPKNPNILNSFKEF